MKRYDDISIEGYVDMNVRKERLKTKMAAGTQASDKFDAADQAMSQGALTFKSPNSMRPIGEGLAVRESVSLLPAESEMVDDLRLKMAAGGRIPNRSEVIRAGILALKAMDTIRLVDTLQLVPRLKPGRPSS